MKKLHFLGGFFERQPPSQPQPTPLEAVPKNRHFRDSGGGGLGGGVSGGVSGLKPLQNKGCTHPETQRHPLTKIFFFLILKTGLSEKMPNV